MLFGTSQRIARQEIFKSRIITVSSICSTNMFICAFLWITIFHYKVILNVSTGKHVVDWDYLLLSGDILQRMLLNSFIKWRSYQYLRIVQLWKPASTRPIFSSLHQLREGQVVPLASLLIESLKPSNIISQLWSANMYVMNLTMK